MVDCNRVRHKEEESCRATWKYGVLPCSGIPKFPKIMELCHVCEFHLQQERHGHIFEQMMQTKMQKQRKEINRQEKIVSTKARLS